MKRPGSKNHGTKRFLGIVLAVGVIAAGTYAFTASNTVGVTKAGDGANTISGYTVSNVQYNAAALDPTLLATYTFDLDSTARSVKAKPLSTQVTYDTCTIVATAVTCTAAAGTTIASLDNLRVIATQ